MKNRNRKHILTAAKRWTARLLCGALLATTAATGFSAMAADGFHTTLENLKGVNGTWRETETGLYSEGGGDNFALSDTVGTDFIFKADATFNQRSGAATLVFFAGDQPSQLAYCANIDLNNKNARIFRFGYSGGDLGARSLPEGLRDQDTYALRVEAIGKTVSFYVDDLLIVSEYVEDRPAVGRLGLLTFDTKVTYQNVVHEDLSAASIPALDSLSLTGMTLETEFESGRYAYKAALPYDKNQVSLAPKAPAGTAVAVTARDAAGEDVPLSEKDGTWTAPLGEKDMDFTVQLTKGRVRVNYNIRGELAVNPDAMYRDAYRPQLHFSPFKNWMNDPNGLVYDPSNQTYHMYYQYNPTGLDIGNQVWAHAESKDMINWTQVEDMAIIQDDGLGAIFSGSAVVDEDNTSGLFTDNKPGESKLVALFTHDGGDTSKGHEKQSLAYSKDHGHTWIKPSLEKEGFQNPVIPNENNKYGGAFRDPKVFRFDGRWMMVVAGGDARIFTSDDLIHWSFAGDLHMNSECPDLFPLAMDGNEDNIKWVYTASGRWYTVGDFQRDTVVDGVQRYKFVRETGEIPYNGGPRVYATQSFYNDGSGKNRRMLVSWLQDHSAGQLAEGGKNWNGVQTIPYETTLRTVDGQPRLISYPIEEIENNRTETLFTVENKTVDKNDQNILGGYGADKCDIEAVFTPGDATVFGFKLRKGAGEETVVKYDAAAKKFILDQSRSGKVYTGVYSQTMTPMADGKIKMRILVDTSVIEAFGNDGEAANSDLFFPDPASIGMEFFTDGTVTIDSLKIYGMKSIWHDDAQTETGLRIPVTNEKIVAGDSLTLNAVVLPAPAGKEVRWTVEDNGVLEKTQAAGYSLTVKALKPGTCKVTAALAGTEEKVEIPLTVMADPFKSNLTGWNFINGRWYKGEKGLHTDGQGGGDVFAVSGTTANVIESYEADVTPPAAGGCPALIFGVTNPASPTSGTWFGANVDTFGSTVKAKLFQNTQGGERWNKMADVPRADTYHLKVTVDADQNISFYVNDTLVGSNQAADYQGGNLGLLTWNSAADFNKVYLDGVPAADPVIELDQASLTLPVGKTARLNVTAIAPEGDSVTWSTDADTVASVNQNGTVTARGPGEAVITARTAGGAEDACRVKVYLPGDLSGDGAVNITDVMQLCRVLARKSNHQEPTEEERLVGDVNGDTNITISDVMALCKILASKGAGDGKTVAYADLAARMVDLEGLAAAAPAGETCSESSAYNKASKYDAETDTYVDWDANWDEGLDAPRSADGGYVIADLTGPGSIVRIWSADPRQGHIKVFIDGGEVPEIDMPFIDLFGTGPAPFDLPELCYEAGRGKNCYVPIPYSESCKVILYDDWGKFYQVNYISFPEDRKVEPFGMPVTAAQQESLQAVNDYFASGIGTAPKAYAGARAEEKTVTVPAGGKVKLLETDQPGAVTGLTVKINGLSEPGADWDALAAMTLSAYWDGDEEPAVWSTLGGFFASITGANAYSSLPLGVSEDDEMYSYWYMPYADGAVLEIGNDGDIPYEIAYRVTTAPLTKAEAAGKLRFHAKWNRAADPEKNDRWPDACFLSTTGTGRYVGTSLHVYKEIGTGDPAYQPDWWWGEGDEKFFVDGEKFPSWFGTGCEDYFGYAWGTWQTFSRPYHSQPFTNGGMYGVGNRLNNRFHIVDSVPFQASFEANLEKYHRDGYANWAFTNFWYLDRDGTDPYGPVSLSDRTAYYKQPYPEAASFIEGEDLSIIESTGMLKAETQDMRPFPADTWSGDSQFILKAYGAGDYVKFWINVPERGEYRLTARFTKAGDFGTVQHAIDGQAIGGQVDLYDPTVRRTDELELGSIVLTPGLHEFTAKITGKNSASSGYFYGLDYIKLDKFGRG